MPPPVPPAKPSRPSSAANAVLLKVGPLAALLEAPRFEFPKDLHLPDLASIELHVPPPGKLNSQDVLSEVTRRARLVAPRRERAVGEAPQMGDDVCVDIVVTSGGAFVPFMIEFEDWRELQPIPAVPGLAEAMAGSAVGQVVTFDFTLPQDFVFASFRGKLAHFVVALLRAVEVRVPPPDAMLKSLGLGKDLKEVSEAIVAEVTGIARSRPVVDRLITDELAKRVPWEPPPELVDHEILCRWADRIGRTSVDRQFSVAQQRELLGHWLAAPWLRREASDRLHGTIALMAIALRDGVQLESDKAPELFAAANSELGVDPVAVANGMKNASPDLHRRVRDLGYLEAVLNHVRSKIKITFD